MAKSIFDELLNAILDNEMPKVNNIMVYMANEIQKDFVNETYRLLDVYYDNYTRPPRKYIRTDELKSSFSKSNRLRGKRGRFSKASKTMLKRKTDTSLMEAMHAGSFGVARMNQNGDGYIGGVVFDQDDVDFNLDMEHSTAGIEEFDIVRNFLFSDVERPSNRAAKYRDFPSADSQLNNYLIAYDNKIYDLYNNAYQKFR